MYAYKYLTEFEELSEPPSNDPTYTGAYVGHPQYIHDTIHLFVSFQQRYGYRWTKKAASPKVSIQPLVVVVVVVVGIIHLNYAVHIAMIRLYTVHSGIREKYSYMHTYTHSVYQEN